MAAAKPRIRVKMRRQTINSDGLKLFDRRDAKSCIGIHITPSQEQARMARIMGFSPNQPDSWPIFAIEDMIALEKARGFNDLQYVLLAACNSPER